MPQPKKSIFNKVLDAFKSSSEVPEVEGEQFTNSLPFDQFDDLTRIKDCVRAYIWALNDYMDVLNSSVMSEKTKAYNARRLRYWFEILKKEVGLNGKA